MLIGGSKKLKSLSMVTLNIKNKEQDNVSSYKYLGVVINETLTWDNHVEYIRSKINKKLGLLKRIKSYLLLSAWITFFNSFILPLFDYGNLVWSDRGNSTLMSELQVLQNNAARIILDLPPRASATDALERLSLKPQQRLSWKTLLRRRAEHRLIFMYKSFNNLFSYTVQCKVNEDFHDYNTRSKQNIRKSKATKRWGHWTTVNTATDVWNNLDLSVRKSKTLSAFKIGLSQAKF